MEAKKAGATLDSLISSFNTRISELQELVIARNMYPGSSIADLSAVDAALKAMELQVQSIKDRLREENEAIPKAKKLIEASLKQQKKLEKMCAYAPCLPQRMAPQNSYVDECVQASALKINPEDKPAVLPKEKKVRASPPLWYITSDELDSLSSYMRGRLTIDKVNAAINDMAAYAEANAQLVTAPKKKVGENHWDKALVNKFMPRDLRCSFKCADCN
ncbi:hypothetical protein SAY86_030025 [Trapa natans]|uniref:Spindle and kinetochore-associated protein 1 homolog n=1 Tax=Trapa natans TaxID=22666 RepID=A0AAN7M4L2_TRANT|nr:hypothetical protein SAY86_030025 [Trapa natans]